MKVRELLTDESRWTQGASARGKSKQGVVSNSKYAVCWCLLGALTRCYGNLPTSEFVPLERELDTYVREITHNQYTNFVTWNDAPERTFDDIKQLIETLDI